MERGMSELIEKLGYQGQAKACRTRVVAYAGRAVSELVEQRDADFAAQVLEDAVEAVRHARELGRRRCGEVFEQRFTSTRMAHHFVQVYQRLTINRQAKV